MRFKARLGTGNRDQVTISLRHSVPDALKKAVDEVWGKKD